jgi:hypothetical protein
MSAVVLTNVERSRRGKLTAMLSSWHDGEIVNAACFLQRMAAAKKITPTELLTSTTASSSLNGNEERARRERENRERRSHGLPADWRKRLRRVMDLPLRKPFLTAWEENVAVDVYNRAMRWPSERQATIIRGTLVKLKIVERSNRARENARYEAWKEGRCHSMTTSRPSAKDFSRAVISRWLSDPLARLRLISIGKRHKACRVTTRMWRTRASCAANRAAPTLMWMTPQPPRRSPP